MPTSHYLSVFILIGVVLGHLHSAEPLDHVAHLFPLGTRILFQGDSITDGNRGRNDDPNHILGHGYQFIIASDLGAHHPERQFIFLNRGISGNRISDLQARWSTDTLALQPDLLSILIGINDATHAWDGRHPTTATIYEQAYADLLTKTRAANPTIRLVLGEPFLLPVGKRAAHYAESLADLKTYQDAVARLGKQFNAPVIHYQKLFDDACTQAPAAYWVWDGVHPTYAGHGLMAEAWLKTVATFYGKAALP